MCNSLISMCVSCRDWFRKENTCMLFDQIKDLNGYDDIYASEWMTAHAQDDPNKVRIDVRFKFCPSCKDENKPEFKPNVRRLARAAEKATEDCLGTFTFTYTNGKVINSWKKTNFGKIDPDMYVTTDTESADDMDSNSDSDSDTDGDNDDYDDADEIEVMKSNV